MLKGKRTFNNKGFTLLEMIVTLVMMGIMVAISGIAFVEMGAKNFIFAQTNTAALQKGQIAITRILKELNNIDEVDPADTNQNRISFTSTAAPGDHSISWDGAGADLLFDGVILTDQVNSFQLAYYNTYNGDAQTTWTSSRRIIGITLAMTGADNTLLTLTGNVAPYQMVGI